MKNGNSLARYQCLCPATGRLRGGHYLHEIALYHRIEPAGRVAESFDSPRSHLIRHREEEVRKRFGIHLDVTARLEAASARTSDHDRKIVMGVAVSPPPFRPRKKKSICG